MIYFENIKETTWEIFIIRRKTEGLRKLSLNLGGKKANQLGTNFCQY